MRKPKDPIECSKEELVQIVKELQKIMFLEPETGDSFFAPWNSEKKCDSYAIFEVANLLFEHGLAPEEE